MTLSRFAVLLLVIGSVSYLLSLLSPILSPFVAAAMLAYICNPFTSRLCLFGVSRTWATVLVLCALLGVFALLLLIMLPLLQRELDVFVARLPALLDTVRLKIVPYLQQHFGGDLVLDSAALQDLLKSHWQSAGGVAAKVLPWLGGSGAALLGVLMNLLLIPLVLFYLLRDWPHILAHIGQAIPRRWHAKVSEIAGDVDNVLGEFLRGQISVMLLMSGFYSVGLWAVGLDFALPIGLVAGMLVFVPYLGMLTGLGLATLAAFTQFDAFSGVLLVWAIFGAGQLLEGMVVTPWLVGERIGLHPLAVVFALLAFGQLFGFFGVLLALPISAALLVGLRHAQAAYFNSATYRGKP
jgi:predicted PurR-regulated permease PerM